MYSVCVSVTVVKSQSYMGVVGLTIALQICFISSKSLYVSACRGILYGLL